MENSVDSGGPVDQNLHCFQKSLYLFSRYLPLYNIALLLRMIDIVEKRCQIRN